MNAAKNPLFRTCRRVIGRGAIVLGLCLLASPSATAQDAGVERELAVAREQIHALMREAEELQQAGRVEAAREHRKKAERIERRIAEFLERRGRSRTERGELGAVLEGLERGMAALRELGRHVELERLERVAAEVREQLAEHGRRMGGAAERGMAERQLEILRVAIHAVHEAGRGEVADQLERAIHARELALAGRDDEEALRIREGAPKRGQLAELLMFSERVLRERQQPDRAELVGGLARELAESLERRQGGEKEREIARRRLKIMRYAVEALAAGERPDAADLVETAIHARELALEGRRDEEAIRIRERVPQRGQLAELLGLAAELLRDAGREERAVAVGRLAHELAAHRERGTPERRDDERRGRAGGEGREWREVLEQLEAAAHRIERFEQRLEGMEQSLERVADELRELKRQRD